LRLRPDRYLAGLKGAERIPAGDDSANQRNAEQPGLKNGVLPLCGNEQTRDCAQRCG
jgi:hypothetical protein